MLYIFHAENRINVSNRAVNMAMATDNGSAFYQNKALLVSSAEVEVIAKRIDAPPVRQYCP